MTATFDAATLEAGIAEVLAATLDADAVDVGATLRPHSDETLAAPRASTEHLFDHAVGTKPPWQALPRLTWRSDADAQVASAHGAAGAAPVEVDLAVRGALGEGGMGLVMLAEQRSLRREVALKTVRPAVDSPRNRELLWREAVVMGQLDHPNIVPVHVLGADGQGRPALVMKRIEGWSWQDVAADPAHPLLRGSDVAPLEFHLEIAARVADALAFAHDRGVVHRDVKPENVMLGRYGEVFLGDWGVAVERANTPEAAAEPVAVAGTPAFMAPEMLYGRRGVLDARTDVFLLGATLHAVLTGEARHRGGNLSATLRAAAAPEPVDYGERVPPDVGALLNHCTAADPSQRPASAAAMRAELRELLRLRSLAPTLQAAFDRLERFDAASAEGNDATQIQLLTEARFGFAQVLAADVDSGPARAGLQATLLRQVRFELRGGHVDRARVALAELQASAEAAGADVGLAALQAEIDAVAARLRAEEAEREALRALGAEHDPKLGRRARMIFILPIALLGGVLFISVTFVNPVRTIQETVEIAWLNFAVVSAAAAFSWRHARTALNRDLVVACLAGIGLVLAHRLLAQTGGAVEIAPVLRDDCLIVAAVAAAVRVPIAYGRLAAFAIMTATAGAVANWPTSAAELFSVGITTMLLALAAPLALAARSEAAPRPVNPDGADQGAS